MAARYSRIRQAKQLENSLTNLRLYEDTPRVRRVNSRGAREPSITVFVVPFGADVETDEVVAVRNVGIGYTALADKINAPTTQGEVTNVRGAKTIVRVAGFNSAKVVWFRNATRSVEEKISDVTKDRYLKYNGTRSSCAFGRKATTDNQYDAFNEIKTAILTTGPTLAVNRVSLIPEKIRYN